MNELRNDEKLESILALGSLLHLLFSVVHTVDEY